MSRIIYCIGQGFSNIRKNILFSAASALTIAACIFIYGMFFCIVVNVQHFTANAESTLGISVFFNEDASAEDKEAFSQAVIARGGVKEMNYISADEAWESFKDDYFGEQAAELAEAFADDNPLATSDSYEIFLNNIEDQESMVEFILSFDIVRDVNYANNVVAAFRTLNSAIYLLSAIIIGVLYAISIFLISNTINMTAHFRKRENQIMRMIGATNGMIRAPFVIEGTVLGLIGAMIPLAAMYYIYRRILGAYTDYMAGNSYLAVLADIAEPLPYETVFPALIVSGLIMGAGTGLIVSSITVRRHLKI